MNEPAEFLYRALLNQPGDDSAPTGIVQYNNCGPITLERESQGTYRIVSGNAVFKQHKTFCLTSDTNTNFHAVIERGDIENVILVQTSASTNQVVDGLDMTPVSIHIAP